MARVFLLNPPGGEPVKTPLLAFCHLAASLRAAGHEVALLDACAAHARHDLAEIAARVRAYGPDLVGLHVKTLHAHAAYAAAAALADIAPLVAGGPHPTVCPEEPFAHGFAFVVRGEGEETLVELAAALDGARPFTEVRSLSFRRGTSVVHNPGRGFLSDLDALAPPLSSLDLFDPAWYGATATLPPAGLLSSRGCPAACTFCSNNVTGRKFRYRSAASVAAEVKELRERFGVFAFSFLDDSFAVGQRRVGELADALFAAGPVAWTCTAHPAHLDPKTLAHMQRAGCGGVDIGMESGDPDMLLRIGKGVTRERVLDVLRWCRDIGMHAIVNLMLAWPDETEAELEATIEFMEEAAPIAGGFNARGVVVPYPGTEIYDRHHERFGFSRWWIDEPPLAYPPFPTSWDAVEIMRAYATDPALDRNFFRHSDRHLGRAQYALAKKAELTLGRVLTPQPAVTVPAAGAR